MPSGTEIPWWEATAARFSYRNGALFPKPPVFELPKRGPIPQTSCFSYRNGAPFQLPKRGPVPQTSRFSYQC